jgi:PHD/YefM family antitoxin component YafN of YafNO toxin-antitoxin module
LIGWALTIHAIQSTVRDSRAFASDTEIIAIRKKEDPNRTYLSVEEYQKLKKHNKPF